MIYYNSKLVSSFTQKLRLTYFCHTLYRHYHSILVVSVGLATNRKNKVCLGRTVMCLRKVLMDNTVSRYTRKPRRDIRKNNLPHPPEDSMRQSFFDKALKLVSSHSMKRMSNEMPSHHVQRILGSKGLT
jgi:hypothetical protein